jgi:hypothetical protein
MPSVKTTMRGIVHEVGDIEFTGANNDYPRQRLVLFCPTQRDQHTGKPNGKDEFFVLDILGNNVETLNITERFLDKVVQVEVRFFGNCYKKQDGSRGFATNTRLYNISIISEAGAEFKRDAIALQLGY